MGAEHSTDPPCVVPDPTGSPENTALPSGLARPQSRRPAISLKRLRTIVVLNVMTTTGEGVAIPTALPSPEQRPQRAASSLPGNSHDKPSQPCLHQANPSVAFGDALPNSQLLSC